MRRSHIIGLGIAVFALVLITASASAFITRGMMEPEKKTVAEKVTRVSHKQHARKENIQWNEARATQAQPACDDGNIVGKLVGGVGGGVAGSQIGSGNGKTAATIGGTLGGAYLGGEYLPTRNATCR